MADFGAPVATSVNVNPTQAVQTLSGLLSLKQQQQALQTGAFEQQAVAARASQATQQNQELQALSQFTRQAVIDPTYRKEDGSLDLEKFQKGAAAAAPVYGQAYIGQATSNANAMIDNRKALLGLSNDQRKTLGGYFGAVAANPNATREDFLDAAERARTVSQDPAYQRSVDRMLMSAPNVRDLPTAQASQAVRQWARGISMETGAPVSAESGPVVQMVQGPQGLVPTNVNPQSPGGVGPVGPTQAQGIAPQIVTSPVTGGQGVVGGSQGLSPRPIGGNGAVLGPNPWQPYAGQQNDIRAFQQEVQGTRSAADAAPTARNINAQILRLADDAKTGPGTEIWQHAVGALAAPFGLSPTASYQELGKFLEKNAIQNMTSMGGPPSDARLSAAAAANGSTHFSPEALKAVTKFNDATNTALIQYREGLDHAVGMGQNVDYTRLPAFKAAWAKNFDVDVFRVENAIRDGDKAELLKIRNELGPERLKALAEKRKNLTLLSEGQLP